MGERRSLRKSIKKAFTGFLAAIVVAPVIFTSSNEVEAATGSVNFTSTESTNRTQSATVTVPSNAIITGVTTNTGSVSYTRTNSTTVTLSLSGGASSRVVTDPQMYSQAISTTETSSTNSFPATMPYSSGGYTGTYSKSGSSYVYSGSYTPSASRTETATRTTSPGGSTSTLPASIPYNSGGYVGTLTGGTATLESGDPAGTWPVTRTRERGYNDAAFPSTIYTTSGNYSGNIPKYGSQVFLGGYAPDTTTTVVSHSYPKPGDILPTKNFGTRTNWNPETSGWPTLVGTYSGDAPFTKYDDWWPIDGVYRQLYRGSVTRNESRRYEQTYKGDLSRPDTRVWRKDYSGTVTRPATDTRVYGQNYTGTAYMSGTTTYYRYSGTVTYIVDTTDPTIGSVTLSPSTWTTGNVVIQVRNITDTGDSGYYRTKLPNGTFSNLTDIDYTATSNGTYRFEVYDNAGNVLTRDVVVSNIDRTEPTGNLAQTPTAWTNGNVTLNLTSIADTGGSGYYRTLLPNGTYSSSTSISHVVTANGTYNFDIFDNAGNVTRRSITVTNIDKTAPTGSVTQSPTAYTSGNVVLTIASIADTGGSGYYRTELPNGTFVTTTSATYTATGNGTYDFTIYDNAGNSRVISHTVGNIDKVAPTGTITPSTTSWTNGNITLTLASIADTGGSGYYRTQLPNGTYSTATSVPHVVSANGTYNFTLYDNVGNSRVVSRTVSNIDTVDPTGTISQSPTGWTNGSVLITVSGIADTGGSGYYRTRLPNGTFSTATSVSQTVSANGSYSFEIFDNAGNSRVVTQVVSNIDTVAPTGAITQTPTAFTGGNVTLTLGSIADTGGSGYYRTKLPNGTFVTTTSATYVVSSGGTYSFEIFDNAGNSRIVSHTVNNIDTVDPTGTITPSTTSWTGGNVTLTLGSIADTGGSGYYRTRLPDGTFSTSTSVPYVATSNGSYSFTLYDNAGNSRVVSYTVSNIDKVAPNGTVSQNPTSWTSGSVVITLASIADTGGSGYYRTRLPDGTFSTATSVSYTASGSGTYSFTVYDNAGNSRVISHTVSNIDSAAPTGTVSQTPTAWTTGNVTLTLSGVADTGGSGYYRTRLPDGTFSTATSMTYVATANGTFSFTLYDNSGNSRVVSHTVSNIDRSLPDGVIAASTTAWTSGSVVLSAKDFVDVGGSGFRRVRLPDGTYSTSDPATYTVSANGTYTFVIEDNAGNSRSKSITVSNIETTAPTGTLTQTPTSWTNGNVTLNLVSIADTGGSGYYRTRLPDGTYESTTSIDHVVTANGTYHFDIYDNAGNVTRRSITVSNIEKVAPTGSVTQSPTAWTNGNVVLTLGSVVDTGGSGYYRTQLPNGTFVTTVGTTYTVSANGTYNFTLFDNAGNSRVVSHTVSNIDKGLPDAVISASTTAWTNGNVVLTVNGFTDVGGSGFRRIQMPDGSYVTTSPSTYTVTSNGTYTFVVEDNAGNLRTKTFTVSNIDKSLPTGDLTQNPTTWTNGNVTLTLANIVDTGGSGYYRTLLPNGTYASTTTVTHVVTANGTYHFDIFDTVGNVTRRSITVSNIDKVAPTASVTQSPTAWTNGSVVLTLGSIVDTGGSGYDRARLPDGTFVTATSATYTVTANGTYSFTLYDNAGNSRIVSHTVSNIDIGLPDGVVEASTASWTNGDVVLSAKDFTDVGGSGFRRVRLPDGTYSSLNPSNYTVSTNGTYNFIVEDNAGNTRTKSITVGNIDKVNPTGTLTASTSSWTNTNVTLTLSGIADTGGSGYYRTRLPDGSFASTTTITHVVTGNGTYNFDIYDNAGNTIRRSITVSNIDKTAPTGTVSQSPTGWTNGNVVLTISGIADTGGSGYYRTMLPNGTYVTTTSATYTVTANGTYNFEIFDNAGNRRVVSHTVSNIDKLVPGGSITASTTAWTNADVVLTIQDMIDNGVSGFRRVQLPNGVYSSTDPSTYTVGSNGTYIFRVEDNAGNVDAKSIVVGNIDKVLPTGTLTQNTTSWVNDKVTLTLSGIADTGGSDYRRTLLPNGTYSTSRTITYDVTANGTYHFDIADNAGNVARRSITITNIDKSLPTGVVTPNPTVWTNGNVTLTLGSVADTGGSGIDRIVLPDGTSVTTASATYTATSNGTYSFEIFDVAGNSRVVSHVVTNIDRALPDGNVVASTTTWTNANVTLTVRDIVDVGGSGYRRVQMPDGSYSTASPATYVVSTNGTYTFRIEDNAGNIRTKTITVTNIDKVLPTFEVISNNTAWTRNDITVQARNFADSASGVFELMLPNGTRVPVGGTAITYPVSVNGTYTFRLFDVAGNETSRSIVVNNIDKLAPNVPSLSLSTYDWSAPGVLMIAVPGTDNGTSGVSHLEYRIDGDAWKTMTSNTMPIPLGYAGELLVEVRAVDRAGNASASVSRIAKIDNTPPVINGVDVLNGERDVLLTVDATDLLSAVGGYRYYMKELGTDADFTLVQDWTPSPTFSRTNLVPNRVYEFRVEVRDLNANVASRDAVYMATSPDIDKVEIRDDDYSNTVYANWFTNLRESDGIELVVSRSGNVTQKLTSGLLFVDRNLNYETEYTYSFQNVITIGGEVISSVPVERKVTTGFPMLELLLDRDPFHKTIFSNQVKVTGSLTFAQGGLASVDVGGVRKTFDLDPIIRNKFSVLIDEPRNETVSIPIVSSLVGKEGLFDVNRTIRVELKPLRIEEPSLDLRNVVYPAGE